MGLCSRGCSERRKNHSLLLVSQTSVFPFILLSYMFVFVESKFLSLTQCSSLSANLSFGNILIWAVVSHVPL